MQNNNIIYTQKYQINTTNVNSNQRLGLTGILGFLQDAASEHAENLGFGLEDMIAKGVIWVLVRQKLKMYQWPNWRDVVTIKTWPKPVKGLYAFREFEIFVNDEKIGECSTSWMVLDIKKRRPVKAEIINELMKFREDYSLDFTAEKVILPDEFSDVKSYEVRNSDIDMNNHVNNIKYSQWSLDSIPFEYHKSHVVDEFEINFISETFLGDKIDCFLQIDHDESEIFIKGFRAKDEKLAFAARIKANKI